MKVVDRTEDSVVFELAEEINMERHVVRQFAPIDFWGGLPTLQEFVAARPEVSQKFLRAWGLGLELAREHLAWTGDIQNGPYVASMPIDGFITHVLLWKQGNNGTTFSVSEVEADRAIRVNLA